MLINGRPLYRHSIPALGLLVSALATPARGALAQEGRVVVSLNELRVEFPLDTTSRYGSAKPDGQYGWTMAVDAIDWPRMLTLTRSEVRPREFASLDAVIAARMPVVCEAHPAGGRCTSRRGDTAYVSEGRVVLLTRDSATIVRMFAGHPPTVRLIVELPGLAGRNMIETVPVTYIWPDVPLPNADLVAEIERTKRMASARKQWVIQKIQGARLRHDTLALTLGDTTTLQIRETRCTQDVCTRPYGGVLGIWTIGDTTVATARAAFRSVTAIGRRVTAAVVVTATGVGATTIRIELPVPTREKVPVTDSERRTLDVHVIVRP